MISNPVDGQKEITDFEVLNVQTTIEMPESDIDSSLDFGWHDHADKESDTEELGNVLHDILYTISVMKPVNSKKWVWCLFAIKTIKQFPYESFSYVWRNAEFIFCYDTLITVYCIGLVK